ncbi:T9SS type A sorting domain-containing protein [Chryseobacterium terrae]|uniref:T9SS type A sorting domain-containing protein n=1 Tax=Chryseobacterium terrae TaxID=3163299 RepID=A0ABW8XZ38_9FLAO
MKKVLSSLLLTSVTITMFGQVVYNENFDALTIGNLTTDITGATAGQNGWYSIAQTTATNSAVSNFQVINSDATHQKALQITGSNGTAGIKAAYKGDIALSWSSRTSGNNVIQYELDFYTGATTTSTNQSSVYFNNVTGSGSTAVSKTLAGFSFNHNTRTPLLSFYMDPCIALANPIYCNAPATYPPGNYTLSFTDASNQTYTLPANTWVKVGFSYNFTSGEVKFKIVNADGTVGVDQTYQGAAAGLAPTSSYVAINPRSSSTQTTNTVAATAAFDNLKLSFVPTSNFLGVKEDNSKTIVKKIALYPNPATDVLNIKADSKINSVSVVDISGKKVNVRLEDNKVNVRSLPAGTYLINVETKDGISTEKFIKK